MRVSRRELLAGGLSLVPAAALASAPTASTTVRIDVPIDHDRAALGRFPLLCEWGAPPRAGRRTVVVVADGQQYYVRPGGAERLQKEIFGPDLNVLTIVGRSRSDAIERLVMKPGGTDWRAAYRLLNWTQWARDIASVIHRLDLEKSGLGLYGRSGGAHLIHQYLTLYPRTRGRVYLQAAVNHELDVAWGVGGDRFWSDFSSSDPRLANELLAWLPAHRKQRRTLVLVLQRQNFFEPLDQLPAVRAKAVRAFMAGDSAAIADMLSRYQIDALEEMRSSLEGVGSAVREYEFVAPRHDPRGETSKLAPFDEAEFYYAEPLSDAPYRSEVRKTNWANLRDQSAEVLQVAGRYDHTCDYRTQIGLNGMTKNSRLVILNDDHVFKRWVATGRQPAFVQTFFRTGASSAAFAREVEALGDLTWSEQPAVR